MTKTRPLGDAEIAELQRLLDGVPDPLEPLDVGSLDGFLCGVLVQPKPVPRDRWLRHVIDVDGRPFPRGHDARSLERLKGLITKRHAELDAAIRQRQWFDPWVFELAAGEHDADRHRGAGAGPDADAEPDAQDEQGEEEEQDVATGGIDAVYPWVAGFATAMELFPAPMDFPALQINEPLALIFRHLAPDDLEDADDLLAEIDSLEPPADLAEAVEGLVRATLLMADVTRPRAVR
ncbi:MAG: UPF0149 family protein [Caldimonas sp.]